MNRPGNRGRNNLYVYMRHWTAAWLKRERSPLFKKLPHSYTLGYPLPVHQFPPLARRLSRAAGRESCQSERTAPIPSPKPSHDSAQITNDTLRCSRSIKGSCAYPITQTGPGTELSTWRLAPCGCRRHLLYYCCGRSKGQNATLGTVRFL